MKTKEINIPCECAGGKDTCGFLRIVDMGGDLEFCWILKKDIKKAKIGIYLKRNGKGFKKLKEFL